MYYPFLRGRQFELIALRELAAEGVTQNVIIPIIEPVKESINNLNLAFNIFEAVDQSIFLIVNPSVGEFPGDTDYYLNYIREKENIVFRPTFLYRNNASYINAKIAEYNLQNCMIIGNNEISSEDTDFVALVNTPEFTHVTIEDPDRNRELRRIVQESGKQFVRLDDLFEPQPRNSNFLDIETHRFSEEHKYFSQDGYNGFSDYTPLSSGYSDGGSTPRAVVIHFTYMNGQNQIWIKHFTSISNDSIANIQGKFGEAANKAVIFCRAENLSNSAITELEDYYDRGHYPGLGTVKKISIKNHLNVVSDYLKTL
ncbi:MAG: hypothetical protein ACJASR_002400 [Psychroserpens sp.]|jgi:hypothetical protein